MTWLAVAIVIVVITFYVFAICLCIGIARSERRHSAMFKDDDLYNDWK